MNVAVINLTRFGDLIQSQAVLDDLHHAGHSVHLICLENFAPAARLLRHVRRIWPLPGAALLQKTATAWPFALGTLQAFTAQVRAAATPDAIFNLTPGAAPRLLASLLAADATPIHGLGLDRSGFGQDSSVWASFVSVAAARRANSPFNLADTWRFMALPLSGARRGSFRLADPSPQSAAWADAFLSASPHTRFVAFQLGASEQRRRWPVAHFRQLGNALWRESGVCPILVGSQGEKPLAQKYAIGADHPFLDAVGSTDISQLAALLQRADLLITNDTGTMHLASGLGLPSLAFFLATAQPWDTGPMLANCCCLEPALPCHPCAFGVPCGHNESCRSRISPASAASLALGWLENGQWQANNITDARVWVTDRDAQGCYQLQAKSANAWTGPGLWHTWWRVFWRQLFDNMENLTLPQTIAFHHLPPLSNQKAVLPLRQGADLLAAIADMAPATARNPQALGKIFLRNCERLQDLWDKERDLSSLSAFWRQFRANQDGNLEVFGQQCQIMAAHVQALSHALEDAHI